MFPTDREMDFQYCYAYVCIQCGIESIDFTETVAHHKTFQTDAYKYIFSIYGIIEIVCQQFD